MRYITTVVVLLMVLAGCGSGEDTTSAAGPETITQPTQQPTTALDPAPQTGEAVDARVIFDGETCSYLGPTIIPSDTEVTFEFDDAAHPAALVVLSVDDETTWEQVLQATGPGTARVVPEWVQQYWAQIESGSLVRRLDPGDYLVTCNTAPEDTDAVHPATLIEVIET